MQRYTCYTYQENGAWFAACVQLPNCVSDGDTSSAALANLQDAIAEYMQSLIEDGLPVPPPIAYNSISWS